ALNHEIARRFPSARAMLNALPEPAPENSSQNGLRPHPSALGTMQTVVLSNPISQPARGAAPGSPTPRAITPKPRAVPTPSSMTSMPTVVLSNPSPPSPVDTAPGPGVSPPAPARNIRPPVKKALERGVRAKALTERGLR